MNNVITANQTAKQNMNSMYLNSTGAKEQMSVINFFAKGTLFFQISSILFSAFGFYFDFVLALGVITAIVLGLALGAFIEASKHYGIKGAFASFEPISRMILGGIAFIMLTIALAYHFKSLNSFKNVSVKQDLQTQVDFERNQILKSNENIEALISNNTELAKVLNNGKGADDYLATKSMQSNTELMQSLTALNGSSYATKKLLSQSEKTANQTSNTLLLLFVTMEIFSVFGLVSKIILSRNTDGNVKEIVSTMDKLNTLESNVMLATETALINNTMERVNNHLNQSPTPPTEATKNSYNQPNKAQIAFNANSASNGYLTGVTNRLGQNEEKPKFLPIINKRNPTTSGTRTEIDNHLKENLNECKKVEKEITEGKQEKTEKEEKKVVDLLKFSHKEGEFIKLLWDNGEVKEGDKLIPKRFVLEQSAKGRDTERELVNLYAKLEDQNLVMFKNGYRALADIENKVKTS